MNVVDISKRYKDMERFLTDMGRIFGRKLTVKLGPVVNGTEVAMTVASKDVHLDPAKFDWSNPVRAWLQTKGMFYHEVMHTVADPVADYGAINPVACKTANMLGDQTGEVRMTNLYPGTRGYYAMNVFDLLLRVKPMPPNTYALVYGRRSFLPKRFVATARALMVAEHNESIVAEVEYIIDEYHRLASDPSTSQGEFERLAYRLANLLGQNVPQMPEHITNGRMSHEAQHADQMPEPSGSEPSESSEELADKEQDGKQEQDDKQADSGGEKDEDKPRSDKPESEYGEKDANGRPEPTYDDREKDGREEEMPTDIEELEELLDQLANDLRANMAEAEGEMAGREAVELGLMGDVVGEPAERASHALATMLRRIQTQAKPGYENEHHAGRLNLRRVRQSRGLSTDIFSQWQPDRRMATKLSVALAIDCSGSMQTDLADVNQMAAAVAKACEEAGPFMNRTMIRYFNSLDQLVKRPEEKFDGSRHLYSEAEGGTNPSDSIQKSLEWFTTETGVKVLIVLTDGQWNLSEAAIKGMQDDIDRRGVVAQVLQLNKSGNAGSYGMPMKVVSLEDVADVVFGVVQEAVRKQARKVLA